MDEQKLSEMLRHLQAPNVQENQKDQVVNLSLAAFDKKMHETAQGSSKRGRLMDINNLMNDVRRMFMQKKYVVSGLAGGVAVCALVAVLGVPFINQQMSMVAGEQGKTGQLAADAPLLELSGVAQNRVETSPVSSALSAIADAVAPAKKEAEFRAMPPESEAKMKASADMAESIVVDGRTGIPVGAPVPQMAAIPMPVSPAIAPMPRPADLLYAPAYQDQGRDQFKDFEENSVKQVAAEPVSTFSIDVDTASYSFVRRQLNNGVLPQKDAVRVEEMINYFDYNYDVPTAGEDPFKPTIAVYQSPWNAGKEIVHIGIKGYDLLEKPKSNLVFLIDTSGSMNSPDKLPLLVNSFKMMLDSLSPDDTVGIVVYAGSAGMVLEPTKVSDKAKIVQALERLQAGGSTAGAEGVRLAYGLAESSLIKGGNNRIILATDGDFNVGITNPEELKDFVERKRSEGIYLSVLGFGQGNYNDLMMQTLAQNGNGNAAYIDNLNEARKVLVQEASSTLFTIAKDVKIQVEFNPAAVSEYRLIGYETRHLNREDFNNDKVDAGEVGSGATVTAIYEVTPVGSVKMVDDLRYADQKTAAEAPAAKVSAKTDELAFLKIRYKKPDSDTSTLMTRAITKADEKTFATLSDDVRFASAVAGFGQMLKRGKFTGGLTYDQIVDTANAARGKDEFGYRTEFVNLVRLAKTAATIEPLK